MVTPVEAEALGTPEPPKPLLPRTSNVPAAVAWMVGTLLSFSLMAISVRQLGGTLNLFELLTVRAVGGLGILLVVMAAQPALFGYLDAAPAVACISCATARISSPTSAGPTPSSCCRSRPCSRSSS